MATLTGSYHCPGSTDAVPRLAGEGHHHRPHRLKAAWRTGRHHRIEADRVSGDPIMERDIGELLGHDKGPVVDDLVGAVIHLIALRIFGTELAIGGEEVRMRLWYGALAGVLRVGDLVGG